MSATALRLPGSLQSFELLSHRNQLTAQRLNLVWIGTLIRRCSDIFRRAAEFEELVPKRVSVNPPGAPSVPLLWMAELVGALLAGIAAVFARSSSSRRKLDFLAAECAQWRFGRLLDHDRGLS